MASVKKRASWKRKPTEEEKDKIHNAAKTGNVNAIQSLAQNGVDVTGYVTGVNTTALMVAAFNGHYNVVTCLLSHGARMNDITSHGNFTLLHLAAINGHVKIIDLLVKNGASISVKDSMNNTPLQLAVDRDKYEAVFFFVKQLKMDITEFDDVEQQKINEQVKKAEKQKIENLAFALALRDGAIKPLGLKLLLFGPEFVGKSCVATTLVGDPFEENSATEGADIDICNTSNWNKITPEEASHRLLSKYLGNLKACAESQTTTAEANIAAETNTRQAKEKQHFFTRTVIQLISPFKKHRPYTIKRDSTSSSKPQVPAVSRYEIDEAKASDDSQKDGIDVTILDFAGQVQYHNTHSVFIRKENVIMVIFNAAQPLSKNVKVRSSTLRSHPMTNVENIHFWMQTVHSVCREPGGKDDKSSLLPVIMLVATHLDLLGDNAEDVKEEIIQALVKELRGKPYAQHLAGHREGLENALRKYCIFLSNKIRDADTICLLQDTIIEVSSGILSKEHPLIYLKIERELMGIEKGVISIEEFHAVAISCGFLPDINSVEFSRALEYFHHCGVVLHFSMIKSLKKIVILSPHWIAKLLSYVLIAHPYQRLGAIGGKEDVSFDILIEKGILVGTFLTFMLSAFNISENVAGFEVQRKQAIDLMKKFGFAAQISPKAKFLEETKIGDEEDAYIVPSLLPEDTSNNRLVPDENTDNVRVVFFHLPDGFLPSVLYDHMVTACINRIGIKEEEILWLRKGKAMMVIDPGQYYCVSLCKENCSIKLSFVLLQESHHSAKRRLELLRYFQSKLEQVMEDFMSATNKAVAYIPCCYCSQLHMELKSLFMGKQQHCPKEMKPIPIEHYYDLVNDQVAEGQVCKAKTIKDLCVVSKEVYLKFYSELVELLPMKDAIFVSHLITLLPGDLKGEVDSKSTKAQAAIHFLDNGIMPALEFGEIESLDTLLSAMEAFNSKPLKHLAKKIKDEIQRSYNNALRESNQSNREEIFATASSEPILSANSQLTFTEGDDLTTAKLNEKPTPKMLSRIAGHLAAHWKRIGYELLELDDVECIDSTTKSDDEKCLGMLIKWLKTDSSASYSKLIDAFNEYGLTTAVEKIKNRVLK